MHDTDVGGGGEDANWPESLPDHIIESPVRDLLQEPIDYSQNILGNLWLEARKYQSYSRLERHRKVHALDADGD
jgi:hypothetical protein